MMTEPSDGALVQRALAGDRQAFGLLVERHQDRMLAYVRYMGFDETEACDLAQDAFVRAFRHLRRCGDPDRFSGRQEADPKHGGPSSEARPQCDLFRAGLALVGVDPTIDVSLDELRVER